MQQKAVKRPTVSEHQDQELVEYLRGIISEMANVVREFNAKGPQQRTDAIPTVWRIPSNATQSARTRAVSRSLTCDEELERAFWELVCRLKVRLKESDFETSYMNKQSAKQFKHRGGNGHQESQTLQELIQKTLSPSGPKNRALREQVKILNSEEIMRICKLLWRKCEAEPFPDMEDEPTQPQSIDSGTSLFHDIVPSAWWDVDKSGPETKRSQAATGSGGSQHNSHVEEYPLGTSDALDASTSIIDSSHSPSVAISSATNRGLSLDGMKTCSRTSLKRKKSPTWKDS